MFPAYVDLVGVLIGVVLIILSAYLVTGIFSAAVVLYEYFKLSIQYWWAKHRK